MEEAILAIEVHEYGPQRSDADSACNENDTLVVVQRQHHRTVRSLNLHLIDEQQSTPTVGHRTRASGSPLCSTTSGIGSEGLVGQPSSTLVSACLSFISSPS